MNYLGQEIEKILPGNVAVGGANMGMVPLFAVMWCPNRAGIWAGYVPADGQELDDNLFPDAAAGIAANNVPTTSNATWLADPTARGSYVAGSSAGKFRVPDYNGKFAGSLGAVFLRGDGTLSAAPAGAIQRDQVGPLQYVNHADLNTTNVFINNVASARAVLPRVGFGVQSAPVTAATDGSKWITNTGNETRPLNVTGCWVIKLFGVVTNMASANAAQLASSYASLGAALQTLDNQIDFTIIYPNGGTAASPANISANTRYVNANPFPGHPVICELQILVSGKWGTPGWWDDGSNARGAVAAQCDDEIITQVAVSSVTVAGGSTNSGGWGGTTLPGNLGQMASAPARVRVWRVKG